MVLVNNQTTTNVTTAAEAADMQPTSGTCVCNTGWNVVSVTRLCRDVFSKKNMVTLCLSARWYKYATSIMHLQRQKLGCRYPSKKSWQYWGPRIRRCNSKQDCLPSNDIYGYCGEGQHPGEICKASHQRGSRCSENGHFAIACHHRPQTSIL